MSEICKKLSLYLDTSVIGGYYDKEFKHHTQLLFQNIKDKRYDVFISDLTQKELLKAPDNVRELFNDLSIEYNVINVSAESIELADKYFVPQKMRRFMNKEFDCVQMSRSIKNEIDKEIRSMSTSQILNYLRDSSSFPRWNVSSENQKPEP